jgi:hypothetical protein
MPNIDETDKAKKVARQASALPLVARKEPHLDILLHRSFGDTEPLSDNLIGLNNQIIMGRVT